MADQQRVEDLAQAWRVSTAVIEELRTLLDDEIRVRGGVLTELTRELPTYREVGELLGITGARVGQLIAQHSHVRNRPAPPGGQPS